MEKKEIKVHFKMYKAGRQWLVAGIAAFGLGITVVNVGGQLVHADALNASALMSPNAKNIVSGQEGTVAGPVSQSENLDLTGSYEDLVNNFTANGDASIKSYGNQATVILTPQKERQSGNLTLNSQIDLNYDFDMTATVAFGKGDGISVGFHTGNTNQVGRNGGSLGFADLPQSFGWKADTYVNAKGGQNKNDTMPNGTQYFGPDPTENEQFGAFVNTDSNGITIDTDAKSAQKIDASFTQLHVHYDAALKTLTIDLTSPAITNSFYHYNDRDAVTKTWTEDISGHIPADGLVSFFVAGATGDAYQQQSFQLKTFNYHAVGTLHVNYVDVDTGELLDSQDIRGRLNEKVTIQKTQDYLETTDNLLKRDYTPVNPNAEDERIIQTDNQEPITIKMKKEYHATVEYVDDDADGKVLDTDTISGTTGQIEHLADIKIALDGYKEDGYAVQNPDELKDFTFTPADNGNTFIYHLTHGHSIEAKPVYRNIDYTGAPADKLPDKVTQTETYKVDTDLVTGKSTYSTVEFPEVKTPDIDGYDANPTQVDGLKLSDGSDPEDVPVEYTAQKSTAKVVIIDDDADGKVVGEPETVSGPVDSDVDYEIELPAHYKLVEGTNPLKGSVTIRPNDTAKVEIHVTHEHQKGTKDVARNIDYTGAPADKLPDKVTQTETYKVDTDLVTGKSTYSTVEFPEVKTPDIDGYDANPTQVDGLKLSDGSDPEDVPVEYTAQKSTAKVVIIDDDADGKVVGEPETVSGPVDSDVEYGAELPEHYELVEGTNPLKGSVTIKPNDAAKVEIHVKHHRTPINPGEPGSFDARVHRIFTRTIHYVYDNGQKAAEDVHQTVTYTRTGFIDDVTKQPVSDAYSNWTASPKGADTWQSVNNPHRTGYATDKPNVESMKVLPDTGDKEVTVLYHATTQNIIVNYIDQDTGKTIKTDTHSGLTNDLWESPVPAGIELCTAKGYNLIENGDPTKGASQLKVGPIDRVYNIYFNHGTTDLNPNDSGHYHDLLNKEVKQTINYVYDEKVDGADPIAPNVQAIKYSRTAVVDNVTQKIVSYGDWQLAEDTPQQTFKDVDSPAIAGYHADQTKVTALPVDANAVNQTITVHYSTNQQPINIQYFDRTANKTLKFDVLKGKTGDTVNNTAPARIQGYVAMGYKVVEDQTAGKQTLTIKPEGNNYRVTLEHTATTVTPENPGDHAAELTKTINQTINYVYPDGSQAAPANHQAIKYTRTAVIESTTNKATAYSAWRPVAGEQFTDVASPAINGYGADQTTVLGVKVTPTAAPEQNVTVHYAALNQPITIQFIQDGTGKVLKMEKLTGKTDETLSYDVEAMIASYLKQGYVLVSNNVPEVAKMGQFKVNAGGNNYQVHLALAPKAPQPSADSTKKQTPATRSGQKKLPNTGEKTNQLGTIGLVVTAMTALFAVGARQQRRD